MGNLKSFFIDLTSTWWGICLIILAAALVIFTLSIIFYKLFFKAFYDFLLAFLALIILSPIFLILSVLIKTSSKGPILFKQKRMGKNKKLFTIHKFRTMRIDAPKDCATHLLEDPEKYITKIGKFMRKTSLDELPQIWDIFRLKMSIIGPRPALYNQEDLIAERDKYNANNVRPGLTGLAQVSGRDELEISVKAKLDGDYIKKITLFGDIKLFFKTIFSVLKKEGVKEGKDSTVATVIIDNEKQNGETENRSFELQENANDLKD